METSTKVKIQIKNRWTGSIIFEYEKEGNTLAETVKEYIRREGKRIECILSVRSSSRPIERFFLGINPGHTPENNKLAALIMEWIEEFERLMVLK